MLDPWIIEEIRRREEEEREHRDSQCSKFLSTCPSTRIRAEARPAAG